MISSLFFDSLCKDLSKVREVIHGQRCFILGRFLQHFEENEFVAGADECLRCFAFAEPVDFLACLPQPGCQACEITVA
ncbi:hypothetical protein D3C71_2033610 [compost metagenome]